MADNHEKSWYNKQFEVHPAYDAKKKVDEAYDPWSKARYRKVYCSKCYYHNFQVIRQEDLARNSGSALKTEAVIEAERMIYTSVYI